MAIYLLQAYQGQGIGHRLVQAAAERLHWLGFSSMLVWVLADNPACRFYEVLGGSPVQEKILLQEKMLQIGGKPLLEIAYGWSDTALLRSEGAGVNRLRCEFRFLI